MYLTPDFARHLRILRPLLRIDKIIGWLSMIGLALLLGKTVYDAWPPSVKGCASRWEGEVVEWRKGENGLYCYRVNYRARQK